MVRRPGLIVLVLAMLAALLGACSSDGGNSRTIEVDSETDDFAGAFRAFFPRDVTVTPGMSVKFRQKWSGEPHTVTLGSEVQDRAKLLLPYILEDVAREPSESTKFPPEVEEAVGKFFGELPFFFGERGVNQAVGQPCYLREGLPKSEKACKENGDSGFDGTQSYYNSGFIPYLGENENEYELKIAEDTKPGTYFYYCTLHGPGMSGQIIVTDDEEEVESQADLNRRGQKEKERIAAPLMAQLEKDRAGEGRFDGFLAGSGDVPSLEGVKGQVNEFVPRTVEAKVGEPVTWTFILSHSISFNVPPYVPFYDVDKNGTVVASQEIYEPAGGWPGRTPPIAEGEGGPDAGESQPPVTIDAGEFDGSGSLKSSGVNWQTGDKYTVTFTKAGTYPMACLVHPGMIGKVVVS